MAKKRILIIDDEADQRESIPQHLGDSYLYSLAASLEEARDILKEEKIHLILLDRMLGNLDAFEVLKSGGFSAKVPIIVLTGRSGEGERQELLSDPSLGVKDFVYKSQAASDASILLEKIAGVLELEPAPRDVRGELNKIYEEKRPASELVCACNAMVEVVDKIEGFSKSDVLVLINGATGTGKDVVANLIHEKSKRKDKPFIAINCAAIPEELLQSELFGHERGSFTGAVSQRKGHFESANGGTVFLDEIGDMSLATQAKVLRMFALLTDDCVLRNYIEDKKITRLGASEPIGVDVRIIAATNRNLKEMVEKGNFREDLFYRIRVGVIHLPPLNQRDGDAELLIEHFLREVETELKQCGSLGISEGALNKLLSYSWPGNVRELRNAMFAAVALTNVRDYGKIITEKHIPEYILDAPAEYLPSDAAVFAQLKEVVDNLSPTNLKKNDIEGYADWLKYCLLKTVLDAHNGNQAAAVRQLSVGQKYFSQKNGAYQKSKEKWG